MDLHRRGLLTGMGAMLIAAPAIVSAANLMPVHGLIMDSGLKSRMWLRGGGMGLNIGDVITIGASPTGWIVTAVNNQSVDLKLFQ